MERRKLTASNSYTVKTPVDTFGPGNEEENGSWTGAMGQVQRRVCSDYGFFKLFTASQWLPFIGSGHLCHSFDNELQEIFLGGLFLYDPNGGVGYRHAVPPHC